MKKTILATFAILSMGLLSACNGIGEKDTLLARIDDEKVYQEDYLYFLKSARTADSLKGRLLYDNFYSKAALASKALHEYPELEKQWEDFFKNMETRVLSSAYRRFYVIECMQYSDEELRQFYLNNKSLFPQDSLGGYELIRMSVATAYDVVKNRAAYEQFVEEYKKKNSNSENIDTMLLKGLFADERRKSLLAASERMDVRFGIASVPYPEISPKEFYEKHKDLFMTIPGYELYHIQGSDSLTLVSMASELTSLESFKQQAAQKSENVVTVKDSGYVGHVKKDYALPYGIGMVDGLSEVLKNKDSGYVTPVMKSTGEGPYHVFFLAKQDLPQIKEFARVEQNIKQGLEKGTYFEIDSSAVVLTRNGEPLFTEADVIEFNNQTYKRALTREFNNRLLRLMASNYAYQLAAQEIHLQQNWDYRAMVRAMRLEYMENAYIEKWLKTDSIPEKELKALYDKIGSPFVPNLSFEQSEKSLRILLGFPINLYKRVFYMDQFIDQSKKTLEESYVGIFGKVNSEFVNALSKRLASQAYESSSVYLYDSSEPEYKPNVSLDELMRVADSLKSAGAYKDAVEKYREMMLMYPENDYHFENIAYECAYAMGESGDYNAAAVEYYSYLKSWPNSPKAEKAMFSYGFILSENLGRNDEAEKVLEEFLQKYPKSELRESAEWLVNNIKSNGKLAEDLMKKIESEQ